MDVPETLLFKYLIFAISPGINFSRYSYKNSAAYTSVTIAFLLLLLIIPFHVYKNTNLFSKIKTTKFGGMMDKLFTGTDPKPKPRQCRYNPPPDDDIHRLDDWDEYWISYVAQCNADDYNTLTVPLISSVGM